MVKNVVIALLALALAVMAALLVHRPAETASAAAPLPLPAQPATVERQHAEAALPDRTEPLPENERLRYEARIAELSSELTSARAQAPTVTPVAPVAPEPERTNPMASMLEALDTPEMKDMLIASQEAMLDTLYGPLLNGLNLDPDTAAVLKDLLLERAVAQMEVGLAMMKPGLTDTERKAQFEEIKTTMSQYEARVEELLDDEGFDVFQQYEKTQPQRVQVQAFKQALPPDQAISPAQEHDLILTMHKETTDFPWTVDLQDQQNFDLDALSENTVRVFLDESERVNDRIAARALDILTEPQHKSFTAAQDRFHAMQAMSLKMAVAMFKGGATKPE